MSRNPNLPARPNFAAAPPAAPTAGPSRQPQRGRAGPSTPAQRPQAYPQYQYPAQPQVQQPAYNLSGGYQAVAAPYGWEGYNPYAYAQAYAPQSYGQALFNPAQPSVTPQGYAYSQTYLAQAQAAPVAIEQPQEPAAKRFRPNPPSLAASSGAGGTWRNCSVSGCKFVGAEQDVAIHEGDRHLLFLNGQPVERSEEEERAMKRKGPVFIEGTGITLETKEDIAKWIAERKAKYPTKERQAEMEKEKSARGDGSGRGGQGRGRGRGGMSVRRMNDPAARAEDWGRPAAEESDFVSSGTRGTGRGRGRDGGQMDGRGRGRGRGRGGFGHGGEGRDTGYPRTGPEEPTADAIPAIKTEDVSATEPADGIAGLGGYDSAAGSGSASSDDSSDDSSSSDSDSDSDESADGDEHATRTDAIKKEESSAPAAAAAPQKPVCKFFAKSGHCRFGDKCYFSHDVNASTAVPRPAATQPDRKPVPRQPPTKKPNPFARPSMLGALLANPIQNTLSQLTQTIRFLVANNMLEGVELKPGQAEEEERERTKITDLDAADTEAAVAPAQPDAAGAGDETTDAAVLDGSPAEESTAQTEVA